MRKPEMNDWIHIVEAGITSHSAEGVESERLRQIATQTGLPAIILAQAVYAGYHNEEPPGVLADADETEMYNRGRRICHEDEEMADIMIAQDTR